MKKLTKQNEEDLCKIIISSKTIHKDVVKYLKDNKLQRSSSKTTHYIKDLIHRLIDTYKLGEKAHIPNIDTKIPLSDEEFNVIVGGLLGDS